jgi:hypothetical protein
MPISTKTGRSDFFKETAKPKIAAYFFVFEQY